MELFLVSAQYAIPIILCPVKESLEQRGILATRMPSQCFI